MNIVFMLLLILTAPIWVPFWLLSKVWKVLAILFLGVLSTGCVHNSAKFQKSPCACQYEPVNVSSVDVGEVRRG